VDGAALAGAAARIKIVRSRVGKRALREEHRSASAQTPFPLSLLNLFFQPADGDKINAKKIVHNKILQLSVPIFCVPALYYATHINTNSVLEKEL